MQNRIKKFCALMQKYMGNEQGATAVEYGLLVAVLSVALIASYELIGGSTNSMWSNLSNNFTSTP